MAYLQDPANGANPIMQRIKPVLESNIQEHSVMKYQEQMNGVTEQMMQQAPPEQATTILQLKWQWHKLHNKLCKLINNGSWLSHQNNSLLCFEQEKVKLTATETTI